MAFYRTYPYFGANVVQEHVVKADSAEEALEDSDTVSSHLLSERVLHDLDGPYEELSDVTEITEEEYRRATAEFKELRAGSEITHVMIKTDGKGNGEITHSDIRDDSLESFLLALACEGVDVSTPAFSQALTTALESTANHDD